MNKNTVTQAQVDAAIKSHETQSIELAGKKHTIVCACLFNDFTITEVTTCVDPANYDEEIGEEIALTRIKDKIWAYLGFELSSRLANPPAMRAKLRITGAENLTHGGQNLKLSAVGKSEGYEEDGSDENNTFADYTPHAELDITISNPALRDQFVLGEEYYVDFSKAITL